MLGQQTIGTCSLCGGAVTLPVVWHGVIPPVPMCSTCGATAAPHGPVIPMQPARRETVTTDTVRLSPYEIDTTAAPTHDTFTGEPITHGLTVGGLHGLTVSTGTFGGAR